jgi:hypothetical protein
MDFISTTGLTRQSADAAEFIVAFVREAPADSISELVVRALSSAELEIEGLSSCPCAVTTWYDACRITDASGTLSEWMAELALNVVLALNSTEVGAVEA